MNKTLFEIELIINQYFTKLNIKSKCKNKCDNKIKLDIHKHKDFAPLFLI